MAVGSGKGQTHNGQDDSGIWDTTPKKLEWQLVPAIRQGVRFAETRLSDLICQNEVIALEFDKYGKNFITRMLSVFKVSIPLTLRNDQDTVSVPMLSCRWHIKLPIILSMAASSQHTSPP